MSYSHWSIKYLDPDNFKPNPTAPKISNSLSRSKLFFITGIIIATHIILGMAAFKPSVFRIVSPSATAQHLRNTFWALMGIDGIAMGGCLIKGVQYNTKEAKQKREALKQWESQNSLNFSRSGVHIENAIAQTRSVVERLIPKLKQIATASLSLEEAKEITLSAEKEIDGLTYYLLTTVPLDPAFLLQHVGKSDKNQEVRKRNTANTLEVLAAIPQLEIALAKVTDPVSSDKSLVQTMLTKLEKLEWLDWK